MQYNPALDGLRAIAVLVVVAFHCRVPIARGGMIGVDLFFVLSGYLITMVLRNEIAATGSISLRRFYWHRALRLWPPLLLMLAGYAAAAPLAFPESNVLFDVLVAATYLTDYAMAFWHEPKMLSHTWSLAVEEHFYLIWPLVILATKSMSRRAMVVALSATFALATVWRIADAYLWLDWYRTYYRFDTRASGLLLGGLIAVTHWRPSETMAAMIGRISAYVLIAAIVLFRFRTLWFTAWGGIVADLAAAGIVMSVIASQNSALYRILAARPLTYVGLISYSIYLWHYPLARLLRDDLSSALAFAIIASAAIAVSALSYEFLERPLKSMRRRITAASTV